jgi:hypothetical protein
MKSSDIGGLQVFILIHELDINIGAKYFSVCLGYGVLVGSVHLVNPILGHANIAL